VSNFLSAYQLIKGHFVPETFKVKATTLSQEKKRHPFLYL